MKRAFAIVCAAGLAWPGFAASPSRAAGGPPSAALSRSLEGLDRAATTLEDLRGQVVVVNFWASWCAPCRKELRVLESWKTGFEEDGAHLLAVSVDRDRRKAAKFVQEMGLDLPFYHDGPDGLAKAFDLPAMPCTVVLDRSGRVAHVAEGGDAEPLEGRRSVVERLSSERPGTPAPSASAAPEGRG